MSNRDGACTVGRGVEPWSEGEEDAELKSLFSPMEKREEGRVVGGKRPSIAEMKAEMYVHCIMFLPVLHMLVSSSLFMVLSMCGTLAITDIILSSLLSPSPRFISYLFSEREEKRKGRGERRRRRREVVCISGLHEVLWLQYRPPMLWSTR